MERYLVSGYIKIYTKKVVFECPEDKDEDED